VHHGRNDKVREPAKQERDARGKHTARLPPGPTRAGELVDILKESCAFDGLHDACREVDRGFRPRQCAEGDFVGDHAYQHVGKGGISIGEKDLQACGFGRREFSVEVGGNALLKIFRQLFHGYYRVVLS
jgi:hypothetical protein